ncbi:helix-turn-helix transcriptional regulator [Amycolatopsis sp. NPDC004079]|uniref:helix-turn-helix domain-containing protein n=1 Tax=Amycolatopsis sp. NPDC004079 TaxID=3154549 RepID=UPI0033B2BBCD
MHPEPNELLRMARDAAGLTQAQLAELANQQVAPGTDKTGAMDADYIGKLERGVHRWPNQEYRRALRTVLDAASDAALGFFSTRHRAATVVISPQRGGGGDDVERKAFLRVLAGSVAGLAFTDPVADFLAGSGNQEIARRVGHSEVEQVGHAARMFANQDHLFGGGMATDAALTQLSASAQLLNGQFATAVVRQAFFAAVGDLADTVAGMCFDAGLHEQAERCFRFAVGCATEAADWSIRAKALSGMANLAVHQARADDARQTKADDALSYAEVALVRADRLSPLVQAMMYSRYARALGAVGQAREADCLAAVGRAEDSFAASSGDEPAWIRYYDQARLERDNGRALLGLALNGGAYDEAERRLRRSIQAFPAGHHRGKALAMANLATLTMSHGDPAHGAELGGDALAAVGAVRSDRVSDAFRQLQAAAAPFRQLPAVRELHGDIRRMVLG